MRIGRVAVIAVLAALGVGLLLVLLLRARATTARVDSGPLAERIVARAEVVPSAGVRHVFAAADGTLVRIRARAGETVEAGQPLAELDVGGQTRTLPAPSRGVVLAVHGEVGDHARAAERGASGPLFELADPSQTELRVEVEEADAAQLVVDLPATIRPIGLPGARAAGRVTRVSARLERRRIGADDARVRADGLVRVAFVAWNGEQPAWPLAARAELSLDVRRRDAAARLPRAAITVQDGRTVVERPGVLWTRLVAVEVLATDEAYAEIRGLAPGDEVIIQSGVR